MALVRLGMPSPRSLHHLRPVDGQLDTEFWREGPEGSALWRKAGAADAILSCITSRADVLRWPA